MKRLRSKSIPYSTTVCNNVQNFAVKIVLACTIAECVSSIWHYSLHPCWLVPSWRYSMPSMEHYLLYRWSFGQSKKSIYQNNEKSNTELELFELASPLLVHVNRREVRIYAVTYMQMIPRFIVPLIY